MVEADHQDQTTTAQAENVGGTFADNVAAVQLGDSSVQMGVPLNQMTSAREVIPTV